ncbi:MAG: Trk system potassium transporter TrkA [Pseudomonadota bacterium]
MKVLVCGAGQVGFSIARYLSLENNDVTVIDTSPSLIQTVQDVLDVKGLVGYASHPDTLNEAEAADADMIIAVTLSDEVNMVACQVAHSLFNVPKKIARIRARSYLETIWADLFSRDHLPIDVIISPEYEVAKSIARRLEVPGTLDMISLADDRVRLVGVSCTPETPIINTPLRQLAALFPDLNIIIVGIVRNDRLSVPSQDDQMLPGDEIYFVAERTHVARAMAAFGHEEPEARRIAVFGGGNIGLSLAEMLEVQDKSISLKVIERERSRAQFVAQTLSRSIVLHGDTLDPAIQNEANVMAAETVIAVTNDDKVNMIASLIAKRQGAPRVVTLINEASYGPLMRSLGVDAVVSPRAITVSTILHHVRRGRIRSVHSLGDAFGEIIEAEALETSEIVGTPMREVDLPAGIVIGAVVHGDDVIIPGAETIIRVGDRVVIFAVSEMVNKVERILRVRPEYF